MSVLLKTPFFHIIVPLSSVRKKNPSPSHVKHTGWLSNRHLFGLEKGPEPQGRKYWDSAEQGKHHSTWMLSIGEL